jgi:hypothetical protein
MMKTADAEKMAQARGYRDVAPENCWADWHRLRVQITGKGFLPKIVLCLFGAEDLKDRCRPILDAEAVEHEWSGHDERMVRSFQASVCGYDASLVEKDFSDIARHAKVLYVLSKNFTAQEAPAVSRSFLRLGGRLLEAGAVALKCESSGIAHGRAHWLELAHATERDDFWSALIHAYVQFPIVNKHDYYSCGLHLLGNPDLIVSAAVLRNAFNSTRNQAGMSVQLFEAFAHYLLAECPDGKFASGHTFSLDSESPRFRVLWEECTGYDEDEFFFNPFGRWRFAD